METIKQFTDEAHLAALRMFCSDVNASASRLGLPYRAELQRIRGLAECVVAPYLVDVPGTGVVAREELEYLGHLGSCAEMERRSGLAESKIPGYYCDDIFKTIDIRIHVAADGTVKVFDISEKEKQIFK
jgi:hypothetical protein